MRVFDALSADAALCLVQVDETKPATDEACIRFQADYVARLIDKTDYPSFDLEGVGVGESHALPMPLVCARVHQSTTQEPTGDICCPAWWCTGGAVLPRVGAQQA